MWGPLFKKTHTMYMRILHIMSESNPLKSRIVLRRLAVARELTVPSAQVRADISRRPGGGRGGARLISFHLT